MKAAWIIPVFALGAAVGLLAARRSAPPDLSRPLVGGLWCPQPVVDLGEVWETDDLRVEFPLVNDDKREAYTVKLRGSCRCMRVEPEELTLAPGERATVAVHVNLQSRPPTAPDRPVDEEVSVTASAGGPRTPTLTLRMSGWVKASYEVTPSELDLGRVVRGASQSADALVRCLSPEPADRLEVTSQSQVLDARAEPLPQVGPNVFKLVVTARPDVPYGPLRDKVRLRAVLAGTPFASVAVPVYGEVVDDIIALPSSVDLGVAAVGAERSTKVTLSSQRGRGFRVTSVETEPESVSAEVREGNSYSVRVRPEAPGELRGSVRFAVVGDDGHECTIEVPVTLLVLAEEELAK